MPVFQWLNSGQESFQLSNKFISLKKYFERQFPDRIPAIFTVASIPLGGEQ